MRRLRWFGGRWLAVLAFAILVAGPATLRAQEEGSDSGGLVGKLFSWGWGAMEYSSDSMRARYLDWWIAAAPEDARPWQSVITLRLDAQDWQGVLDAAEQIKGGSPSQQADISSLRGDALWALERPREARRAWAKAVNTDVESWRGWRGMARTSFARGRYTAAYKQAARARKTAPGGDIPLARLYARSASGAEEWVAAHDAWLVLARLDDKDAEAWREAGIAMWQAGGWSDAPPLLERAIALNPDDARLQWGWGLSLASLKKWQEAERAFVRATEIAPSSGSAWRELGGARRALENYASARKALEQAVKLDPKDAEAWSGLAHTALDLKDRATAEAILPTLRKLDASFLARRLSRRLLGS